MRILDKFRRQPRVHRAQVESHVHPEEADPLMDKVVQVCAYDLPGFTVVRPEAEASWVAETVERHAAALDEWTSDVFDHELEQRHQIRLAHIDAQRGARSQEATRALAETEAVLTAVAVRVAELRGREHGLSEELRGWTRVLTGQASTFEATFSDGAEPPVVAAPVVVARLVATLLSTVETSGAAPEAVPEPLPVPEPDQRAA